MDPNITAPVRGRIIKPKRDKGKIISGIIIISFVILVSGYLTYWKFMQYPGILEEKEQVAIELNETLINQGRLIGQQEFYDRVESLRINCESLVLNYTNQDNQSILLTYWPVEYCMSEDQVNCVLDLAGE